MSVSLTSQHLQVSNTWIKKYFILQLVKKSSSKLNCSSVLSELSVVVGAHAARLITDEVTHYMYSR